nr:hypothetical protein [Tanacetum cinerariifolium]
MVPDEEDKVERFIRGLPDNIQGNVIAANPARLQDTIRIANQLMDKKLQGYAARSAENKRRMESNPRDYRGQQPSFKRKNTTGQNVAIAYTARNNKRKGIGCPLVADEIKAREAAKNLETLNENEEEQEGENGGNEGNGNRDNGGNKNGGNGGNRGNGENGNRGMNYGCFMPMARECTF